MKAIAKGAVVASAGASLLGASLALSSATVVSGASRVHPDKSSISCCKNSGYCFTVKNTGSGNAVVGAAASAVGVSGGGYTGVHGSV
jgi:hypothetical protein